MKLDFLWVLCLLQVVLINNYMMIKDWITEKLNVSNIYDFFIKLIL